MNAGPRFSPGQRVKYVGIHGRADGPTGRVNGTHKSGDVRVRWDDGRGETVHPEDIVVTAAAHRLVDAPASGPWSGSPDLPAGCHQLAQDLPGPVGDAGPGHPAGGGR
jgi:hypothetical protein